MRAPKEDVISRLNTLIEACKDREQGYRTAAEGARNQDLKALLHSYEGQSAGFVADLQAEVKRLGGEPAQTGSLAGWLTRGWQHLAKAVSGGDDRAVIVGCERGEEAARAAYEAALADPLPDEVRAVAERQYAAVKSGHERLRALEAVAAGAAGA
ncbi:MAG TPA: PA2169 family four-helix-bundle protein [Gemmataceae bacterium]|nr:PA2169 family four-helix-bundle protein [Gemmataceae bacterium]